ncbi:hypothetical protein [Bradyrhizobium sp. 1(2017)]|uniref:hypothetical protein n=1 Tax=Bradyrhizobium sp. 1(2017) TaxID=1404888 RepID=UPI00140F4A06|nr:hypothetical protein [Bradyrhizobium sp. 1(2017)]QIO34334.1 hypothetical protein HAP40_22320 [Bradyrhizobium sp. 1(2017)]
MSDEFDRIIETALDKSFHNGVATTVALFEHYASLGYCPFCCLREVRKKFLLPQPEDTRQ